MLVDGDLILVFIWEKGARFEDGDECRWDLFCSQQLSIDFRGHMPSG